MGQGFKQTAKSPQKLPCAPAVLSFPHPPGVIAHIGILDVNSTGKFMHSITNHSLSSSKSLSLKGFCDWAVERMLQLGANGISGPTVEEHREIMG